MKKIFDTIDEMCINTIRTLCIDAIQKANSGHPGLPLGASPMAYILWQYILKTSIDDPTWRNRDRFILSAGHGSMMLYALLHLYGFRVSLDDLKAFRQYKSITPGHPEWKITEGVDATTGPLGQGLANAVGMSIAERILANYFNRPNYTIVDHHTYALVSDGDIMEGISSEASSLAGHLKLGKLIYLYDSNHVSLDGDTSITFTENVKKRYESYGFQVLDVKDGDHNLSSIYEAILLAKQDTKRPSMIIINTTIGFGSPNKAGTSKSHGAPLGLDEVQLTKKNLWGDIKHDFYISEKAQKHFLQAVERNKKEYSVWKHTFDEYKKLYPNLANTYLNYQNVPSYNFNELPSFKESDIISTRAASSIYMNKIVEKEPFFIGGDADLSCSTKTAIKNSTSFNGQTGEGRNIHYGVREHSMGGIANGIAYYGGIRNFTATFFCFSDYMKPAIRLAAMNNLPVIFIFTHDSIGVGEDGPTHQPIEHLITLRSIPSLCVIRPCDANEVSSAWRFAITYQKGPIALILTRQDLKVIKRTKENDANLLQKGAYIIKDPPSKKPQIILIATGSEVHNALEVAMVLDAENLPTRVVSMPSWEIFSEQETSYQHKILPPDIKMKVSIEAGTTLGWERFIGTRGLSIGIDHFGSSAPAKILWEKLGFSTNSITNSIRSHFNIS